MGEAPAGQEGQGVVVGCAGRGAEGDHDQAGVDRKVQHVVVQVQLADDGVVDVLYTGAVHAVHAVHAVQAVQAVQAGKLQWERGGGRQ